MTSQPQPNDHPATPAAQSARASVAQITRGSQTNFFYAFLTMPRPQREAIFAVYAFCHSVDDAVDEAPDPSVGAGQLDEWRREIELLFQGRPEHPITVPLAAAVERFNLPRQFFDQVITGVGIDLLPRRFETWSDLAHYCDLVAGAVGRLVVRILGAEDVRADDYAQAMGTALQLTNILRDLAPDARRGRFYLPQEDLRRFSLTEEQVLGSGPLRNGLLHFEAERARDFYRQAAALGRNRARQFYAAEVMGAIYHRLLDQLESRGFPAVEPVLRLSRPRKAWIALTTAFRCRFSGKAD